MSWFAVSQRMFWPSLMNRMSRLGPWTFPGLSALKNSMIVPEAKVKKRSVAFHLASSRSAPAMIFSFWRISSKSRMAPFLRCGRVSETTEMTRLRFEPTARTTRNWSALYVFVLLVPPRESTPLSPSLKARAISSNTLVVSMLCYCSLSIMSLRTCAVSWLVTFTTTPVTCAFMSISCFST